MYKSLIILGRQADISIAELESLYRSENISLFGKSSVILNLDPKLIDFKRIGGSLRLCQIISTINFKDFSPFKLTHDPQILYTININIKGIQN